MIPPCRLHCGLALAALALLAEPSAAAPLPAPRLCPSPPAAVSPASSPRGLSSRVRDGETGRPVAGALVWETARPAALRRADEQGRFRSAAPAGSRLCAAAPGFVALEQAVPPPGPGGDAGPQLVLWPARVVRGKVLTADHRPLSTARAHLGAARPLAGAAGAIRAALPDAARVRPDGSFELVLAGVDRAFLTVHAAGFAPASVEAAGRGRRPIDLGEIVLARLATLAGEVHDGGGRPIPGATVTAADSVGSAQAVTGGDGEFTLSDLRPGEALTLRVERRGFPPAIVSGVAVPRLRPLAIELARARILRGRVVDSEGDPVAGASVVALALPPSLSNPASAARLPELGRPVGQATAGADGGFTLRDLAPGRLRLVANARGFLPASDGEIEVPEEGESDALELTLRRGAVVEGRVLTARGDPAPGARVRVVDNGDRSFGAEPPATAADEDGRYRLAGVAPGARALRAERDDAPPATASLAVGSGANHLDLTLRTGTEVAGRVVTSAGEPVAGAELALLPIDPVDVAGVPSAPPPQTSRPAGDFRWSAVADGRYRLRAEKAGYGGGPLEVTVAGEPVSGLELRLEAGGAIAGRIAGVSPAELPLVEVRASAPDHRDQLAVPGADGRYRIDELGPGPWTVVAQLAGTARVARGGAVVPPGGEAALDLALGSGLALAGVVVRGAAPVAGAWVTVWNALGSAGAPTGADGRFRIEGLAPGPCEITVVHPASGLERDVRIDLEADADLTLELPDAAPEERRSASP